MFKKAQTLISRALLLGVLSIGLTFAPTTPASAEIVYSCTGNWNGALRLYDEFFLNGPRQISFLSGGTWYNLADYPFDYQSSWDNRASSVYNASNCTAILAEGQNGRGWWITIKPGESYSLGYGWNNIVSSVYLY